MGEQVEAGMFSPGEIIERYTVESLIGEGGMASVYRVRHTQLDTLYALKVLNFTRHRRMRERILQEGKVQATINHPNIVRVFDVLDVDGAPSLLMEYVDGPSLEEWLDGRRPSLEEAESLFRSVVAGVAEAHRHGVVHRDLKPANVLLAKHLGRWVPKVTDFGIVKVFDNDNSIDNTKTGHAMGTPCYMAPEQISDAKNVDARADLFSLGCILFELVCGERAFTGKNPLVIMSRVSTGKYPRPEALVPGLPERIVSVIDFCLNPDPDQRVQSCVGLLELLAPEGETWDHGLPMATEELAQPVPSPSGGPSIALIAGSALGGAVSAFLAVLVLFAVTRGEPSAEPPPDEAAAPVVVEVPEVDPADEAAVGPACDRSKRKVVGYVRAPSWLTVGKGDLWVMQAPRNVRDDYPRSRSDYALAPVVCVLRLDERLRVEKDPIEVEGNGLWVPVVGTALE